MPLSNLFVGTAGWSWPDWSGKFYPDGMDAGHFLEHYAKEFRAVEVDVTYHETPSAKTLDNWRKRAPDGFYFCPLAPESLMGGSDLKASGPELKSFLKAMERLGGKLGPIIFEFPAAFSLSRFNELDHFLRSLPKGFRFAVEMRGGQWRLGVFEELLRELDIAPATTLFPGIRRAPQASKDLLVVRWAGTKDKSAAPGDLELWAKHIWSHLAAGRVVFGFIAESYTGFSPVAARRLVDMIEEHKRLAGK